MRFCGKVNAAPSIKLNPISGTLHEALEWMQYVSTTEIPIWPTNGEPTIMSHPIESGGLHYPSDTAAGVMVARQFVDLLLQNPDFVTLLDNAKTEWPTSKK